ncbi:MAG TPA: halocarboxylic acid dehydrogenase DehI family protein [Candidatus Eremiobacteraceae bacterium]|nr:halocarboxylic acid dehydrogenase DehI family protein [Candidatus Eremiobacteraceae bacterium]
MTLRLVPESEAEDERAVEVYRDLKHSLRVPIVASLFQAYAAWPRFLDAMWRRLRPSLLAASFLKRSQTIADTADSAISEWPVADHSSALSIRHNAREIARMRDLVELFHHLNPKLLIIASAVDGALTDGVIGGLGNTGPRQPGASYDIGYDHRTVSVAFANERESPLRVRSIFEDMKSVADPFAIDAEHRAIATSPDWLEIWWRDCKPTYSDPRRASLRDKLRDDGRAAAQELPYRLALSGELLSDLGVQGAEREQITQTNRLFCESLPGLIIDTAIARKGLR